MDIRRSAATSRNRRVRASAGRGDEGNRAWLSSRATAGAVVFIGGADLVDFRVRVSQGVLRQDLLPSFWSLTGVAASASSFYSVPLSVGRDPARVPASNAVRRLRFSAFDDPDRYPNVAVITFAEPGPALARNVERLMTQRSAVDLPSMLLPWLGYVWGAARQGNPLVEQSGLPSAALVETAFGMSGIELTPGLASGSSCPEAIWQSALWWHDYYRDTAGLSGAPLATDRQGAASLPRHAQPSAVVPRGEHRVRQPAAAVTWED